MKKYLNLFVRYFTGALFIFSGIVKLNDPSGFAIKLNEYFDVFAQDVAVQQDSVSLICEVNNKKLIAKTYALYAFDKVKAVEWHINPTKVDNPPPFTRFEVFGTWGGTQFISDSFVDPPVLTAKFILQKNNQIVFEKIEKIDTNQYGIRDYAYQIDLEKFVKQETWLHGFFKSCKNYSLYFSIFFCALEVILGFAMIIAWQMDIALLITAVLVVFFTFLTWYSAYYNKVTDCGCFGDFLKLKPWVSFKKDLVLIVLVLIMYLGKKNYSSWFEKQRGNIIMLVFSGGTLLFGILCYLYLPLWDFLPYKKGNDIKQIMTFVPKGERATDSVTLKFVLQKGSDSVKVTSKEYAAYTEKGYTFSRQDRQIIIEGYKSPIHDFSIMDQTRGIDYTDTMLNAKVPQIFYIVPVLDAANTKQIEKVIAIYKWAIANKYKFYALTSASAEPAKQFCLKYKLPFELFASDQKMLMTMARYNPTLYLFDDATVKDKWSGNHIPTIENLQSYLK